MNLPEETFESWAKGPGTTEADKCKNAETAVQKAINASNELKAWDISVFAQGSYKARTNVRQESDVDICVCSSRAFFPHYPAGKSQTDFGNKDSAFSYKDFKNSVEKALKDYFGKDGVTRGNKAFDIHPNTYRLDADVVAALEHRRYTGRSLADGSDQYLSGVAFDSDSGTRIVNWPTYNYNNGVAKNNRCNRHYKRAVRILKRLAYKMKNEGHSSADGIGSFLVESLVYNSPDASFMHDLYSQDIRAILLDLWQRTKPDSSEARVMTEVNGIKLLFGDHQSWSQSQVHTFLEGAWRHIGFK